MTETPEVEIDINVVAPTRALAKIANKYYKAVRPHAAKDKVGVIRQMQRLVLKGVTPEMLETAIDNYVKSLVEENTDPRFRKRIRSFLEINNVLLWQKPLPTRPKPPRDHALDAMDRFDDYLETKA